MADRLTPVEPDERKLMFGPPHSWTHGMNLLVAMYDGVVLSGFSFFPALPWEAVARPPNAPSPHVAAEAINVMPDVEGYDYAMYGGAGGVVLLAFLLQLAANGAFGNEPWSLGSQILVTEWFFNFFSSSVMKKLVDMFSCTRGHIWHRDRDGGNGTRACAPELEAASCMDGLPDQECWSTGHLAAIWGVMVLLSSYYAASMLVKIHNQSKTSAVIVDGAFYLIVFQFKFFMAALSSGWGDCHPEVVIGGVETAVIIMLLTTTEVGRSVLKKAGCARCFSFKSAKEIDKLETRRFSNVVVLNGVRLVALAAAAVNGICAAYVAIVYDETMCGTREEGKIVILSRFVAVRLANPKSITISVTALGPRKPGKFAEFWALVALNAAVLICLPVYCAHQNRMFKDRKMDPQLELEVDYAIVRKRLQTYSKPGGKDGGCCSRCGRGSKVAVVASDRGALARESRRKLTLEHDSTFSRRHLASATGAFELYVSEKKSKDVLEPQQIEDVTLDLVFSNPSTAPPHVSLRNMDLRIVGGLRVFGLISKRSSMQSCWQRFTVCPKEVVRKLLCSGERPKQQISVHFCAEDGCLGAAEQTVMKLLQIPRLVDLDIAGCEFTLADLLHADNFKTPHQHVDEATLEDLVCLSIDSSNGKPLILPNFYELCTFWTNLQVEQGKLSLGDDPDRDLELRPGHAAMLAERLGDGEDDVRHLEISSGPKLLVHTEEWQEKRRSPAQPNPEEYAEWNHLCSKVGELSALDALVMCNIGLNSYGLALMCDHWDEKTLKTLDLSGNDLFGVDVNAAEDAPEEARHDDGDGWSKLCDRLVKMEVVELSLSSNAFVRADALDMLTSVLDDRDCRIQTLRVANCGLAESTHEHLTRCLSVKLRHLDISKNAIGTVGKMAVAAALPNAEGLESLHIDLGQKGMRIELAVGQSITTQGCDLRNDDLHVLAGWVALHSKSEKAAIESLDLSGNVNMLLDEHGGRPRQALGWDALCGNLAGDAAWRLDTLYISNCELEIAATTPLAECVIHLKHLDIVGNAFGTEGMAVVSESLGRANRIETVRVDFGEDGHNVKTLRAKEQELDLRPGAGSDQDAVPQNFRACDLALLDAWLSNEQVQTMALRLDNNRLEAAAWRAFAGSLSAIHIERLTVRNCGLTSGAFDGLKFPPSLTDLDMAQNDFTGGWDKFSAALQKTKIASLLLQHCAITEHDARGLCSLKRHNDTLQMLDLSGNDCSGSGLNELLWALAESQSSLDLSNTGLVLTANCVDALVDFLKKTPNGTEVSINLKDNPLGAAGSSTEADRLGDAFRSVEHIRTLLGVNSETCGSDVVTTIDEATAKLLAAEISEQRAIGHIDRFSLLKPPDGAAGSSWDLGADGVLHLKRAFAKAIGVKTVCGLKQGHVHLDWPRDVFVGDEAEVDRMLLAGELAVDRTNSFGNDVRSIDLAESGETKQYSLKDSETQKMLVSAGLRDADAVLISHWVQQPWPLHYLDLSSNKIGERGKAALAQGVVHDGCNLETLSLDSREGKTITLQSQSGGSLGMTDHGLGLEDARLIASWVAMTARRDDCDNIATVDLCDNPSMLGPSAHLQSWKKVCKRMAEHGTVETLRLANVGMHAEAAAILGWRMDGQKLNLDITRNPLSTAQ